MRAALPEEITHVIQKANIFLQDVNPSLIAKIPNIVVPEIKDCRATPLEISQFSSLYLEERRKAVGQILGNNAFSESTTALIVVPVAKLFAFTCHEKGQNFVVLSLGFLELLRFEAATAILQSYFNKAIVSAENLANMENDGVSLQGIMKVAEEIFRFLQASAVLYFIHPGYLPRIEDYLEESLCRRITILLEPCLMFIILHELGHIHFRKHQGHTNSEIDINSEFLLNEDFNLSKAEELFADEFALKLVPEGFRLLLLHGALLFFNIYNYYEALTQASPKEHPFSLNRITVLYRKSICGQTIEEISDAAIKKAIEKGKDFWIRLKPLETVSIEEKIDYLKAYVDKSKDNLNFEFFTMLINRFYLEIENKKNGDSSC